MANGVQLWASRYDGPAHGNDGAASLSTASSGLVVVTGVSDGVGTGSDVATVAYDADTGSQAWASRYDGPAHGADRGSSVAVASDGATVFATGASDGGAATNDDYITLSYDASTDGALWNARYNGPLASLDAATSIALTTGGTRVLVTGNLRSLAYAAGTGATQAAQPGGGCDALVGVSTDGTKVFIVGTTCNGDHVVTAYDGSTAALIWSTSVGRAGATALAVSHDGTKLFVTGSTHDRPHEYLTTAYDTANGARLWQRLYGPPPQGGNQAAAIGVSSDDSRVFVTGRNAGPSGDDYATLAYDAATGHTLWNSRYDGSGKGDDRASSLTVSSDGKVFVTGSSYGGSVRSNDYATIAYSAATGAKLWGAHYNGPANRGDAASSIILSDDGTKAFVTGSSSGGGATADDYATVAYDTANGAQLWAARFDGPGHGNDEAKAIAVGGDKVFVTGPSYGGPATLSDYATVEYDQSTGAPLWTSRYNGPGSGDDVANAIAATADGSRVFVTGSSYGGPMTATDYATVAYQG
jgi:outer membrane protein assembly factor BamB